MADGLVTQGAVRALVKDGAGMGRVTQAAVHALAAGSGPARATQLMALALVPSPSHQAQLSQAFVMAMTQTVMVAQVSQGTVRALVRDIPCLTRWAQCWRIERRDGQVFRFTSHDQPLRYRGESYQPCHSLAATAAELGTQLGAPGNVEMAGIIADETITANDLYAGLFDRAAIEVWLLPWENAGGEIPLRLTAGITGNLSQGPLGFSMEVLTPGVQLQQQPLLEVYTPGCRYELGDERCGVDLDALAVNGTVTQVAASDVATRAHHRVFWDGDRLEADGYFDLGILQWTSGPSAGQLSEIKRYASGQFVLWRPALYNIEVGDHYQARPGCDKLPGTCQAKFNNLINFGGFKDVPGQDSIMRTPDAK